MLKSSDISSFSLMGTVFTSISGVPQGSVLGPMILMPIFKVIKWSYCTRYITKKVESIIY